MTWTVILTALWFGILTSISPCPLATNIAAISFIARKVDKMRTVVLSGILYTVGRTVAYLGLGALIMAGFAFASQKLGSAFNRLSQIERWVRRITGVIFILAGIYYSLAYVYELPIKLW